jgi:hypothetical protein
MQVLSKKSIVIGTAGVMLIVGTGVAYAYWSAGGTGTGTAPTGASTALVVNQTSVLGPMFPGDTAQTLSGTFDNVGSGTVHVTSVTASIASVAGGDGACSAADYTLANATMSAVQEVPVGTSQGAWTGATLHFNNTTANQDGCKNAVVTLSYAVA